MATNGQSPVAPSTNLTNGDTQTTLPVAVAKKARGKKEKPTEDEKAKAIAARLTQLEQERAGEKDQKAEVDREVKKASRDLSHSMTGVDDPLQRIEIVHKKYEELVAEMKKVERDHAKSKKRADQLQKDQDKAKSEHSKTASMKDKLEKLCRELTKENKKVKDDNKKLDENEKAARIMANDRLDQMLYDVQDVLNAKTTSQSANLHLELDELFKTRCKVLFDQADLRDMHYRSILRHKDAEIAHLAAKHEVERKRADTEATRCRTLTNQVSTFSHTEAELRSQLNIYVEKFKQVEDTLNNSNELFLTFRKEMEEMSKKTKRLEKENVTLSRKHDQTSRNILEMAEERTRDKNMLDKLHKQETQMRNIIKTMQEQGRGAGVSHDAINSLNMVEGDGVDEEGTESDYDEEYDEDDEDDEELYEGEEDDLIEPEPGKRVFGPVPPPNLGEVKVNGTAVKTSAVTNGARFV